jgi:hypothetical protein
MIEAVENHMPEVIVIDEIGTELEAQAARTIAERGVQLIATAHGNTLENLMLNPTLSDLVGGIQSVTLSDEEARRRGTQKSILERKAPPTFTAMVEIVDREEVIVHRNVAATVDSILRGVTPPSEMRRRLPDGSVESSSGEDARRDPSGRVRHTSAGATLTALANGPASPRRSQPPAQAETRERTGVIEPFPGSQHGADAAAPVSAETGDAVPVDPRNPFARGRGTAEKPLRIFPYGVSRNRLHQAILRDRYPAVLVRDARDADIIVTLKNIFRRKPELLRSAEVTGTPVLVSRSNSAAQLEDVLRTLFPNAGVDTPVEAQEEPDDAPANGEYRLVEALSEAESAIMRVIEGGTAESLEPQNVGIRRRQHELADRYNLASRSRGREPHRHVEIYRQGAQ